MGRLTDRGFNIFSGTSTIKVIESSLAFHGPHVHIYGGKDEVGHVHLSLSDAKIILKGLQEFVTMAENNELTEKGAPDESI
jgi:hypothetical protein